MGDGDGGGDGGDGGGSGDGGDGSGGGGAAAAAAVSGVLPADVLFFAGSVVRPASPTAAAATPTAAAAVSQLPDLREDVHQPQVAVAAPSRPLWRDHVSPVRCHLLSEVALPRPHAALSRRLLSSVAPLSCHGTS